MSAECTGWVYRYSPAKGAAFLVHLAAADSANDQHGYELWMRQQWLAAKARVSRRAASDALAWLVENGLLELLDSGKAKGSANRYRFLMPADLPPIWTPEGTQPLRTPSADRSHLGTQDLPTGVRSLFAHNPRENPTEEPKENTARGVVLAAGFDRFWSAWPRKVAKGAARKAFATAVRATGSVELLVAAAEAYRDDPNLPPVQFIPHPATWLRDERYLDGPLPPRGTIAASPARRIMEDRNGPEGRLEL